eukprot:1061310-Pleurochrysis_carterae.AAC.1
MQCTRAAGRGLAAPWLRRWASGGGSARLQTAWHRKPPGAGQVQLSKHRCRLYSFVFICDFDFVNRRTQAQSLLLMKLRFIKTELSDVPRLAPRQLHPM